MGKKYLYYLFWIVLVLSIIFSYDYIKHKRLEKSHKYTIGKVYGFGNKIRGGIDILYDFEVNGVVYEGKIPSVFSKEERLDLLDKYFVVKFNPINPKLNIINLDKQIKDSLFKAPPNGWDNESDINL